VEKALKELGFGEYVQEVLDVASEHKEQLKARGRKSRYVRRSNTDLLGADRRGRRNRASWSRAGCPRRSC